LLKKAQRLPGSRQSGISTDGFTFAGPNLLQRRMKTIANLIVRQFLHVRFAATEIIAIVSSQSCKIHTDSCIQKGYFRRCWNSQPPSDSVRDMRSSDIICPQCNAGYRRIEVASSRRTKGEYRCLLCDHVLEVFDGSTEVGIRLTVQPEKTAK